VLDTGDIHFNNDRFIIADTKYPEGERFTLQLIEISDAIGRSTAEQFCQVGRDTVFSTGTQMAKPSGVLLHYNYGAATVKWWGHHTEILRSRDPPHPPAPAPAPAPGPSTGVPPYVRSPPTSTHDRHIAIEKRQQHSTEEPVKESKVWESWDEDDWMLFCRLNTKAARERLQVAEEESSSNIRAWAQDVSEH
jgi:hypothetical protein